MRLPVVILVACALGACGRRSTTILRSNPTGAAVYEQGRKLGVTPYTLSDMRTSGSCRTFVLVLEGGAALTVSVQRDQWSERAVRQAGARYGAHYRPEYAFSLGDVPPKSVDEPEPSAAAPGARVALWTNVRVTRTDGREHVGQAISKSEHEIVVKSAHDVAVVKTGDIASIEVLPGGGAPLLGPVAEQRPCPELERPGWVRSLSAFRTLSLFCSCPVVPLP